MSVSRESVKQIRGLKAEINAIQSEIDKIPEVTDVVRGSSPEFPYTEHPIAIYGQDEQRAAKLRKKLLLKMAELQDILDEAENIIETQPDAETRAILRLYYCFGKTQREIADDLRYSRSAIAMKIQKFFNQDNV